MSTTFGMIAGRVVGSAGEPIPGATVAAIGGSQPHHDIAAITSGDGTFRFGSLIPGLYRVEARASGDMRSADVAVRPGARADVEISLAAPAPIPAPSGEDHTPFAVNRRERVTNTGAYPMRCVCWLQVTAANGARRMATGWLAARRLVVTAGHALYMHDEGGWASGVRVIPACDGLEYPFGSLLAGSADLRSVAGWTENEDPDFDYGAIILPPQQPYGDALGWFGFEPRDDATVASAILDLCGYPNDGGGPGMQQGTQWLTTGLAFESAARQLRYAIRADPGEDGAPVWMPNAAGGPCCVAIHTWSGINGSAGVRMNAEVFQRIAEWASEAP